MTRPLPTVEELFNSGGGAKIHFNRHSQIGDSLEGTVISSTVQQATDIDTRELKFYPDGNPVTDLVLTVKSNLRDRSIEDDDGSRRFFMRWAGPNVAALKAATNKAGDKFVREGSWIRITVTGFGPTSGAKQPPKEYSFEYRQPPSDVEKLMSDPEPAGATVTELPRQQQPPGVAAYAETTASPVTGQEPDAITEAARVQAERRAQIAKVKKLNEAGFTPTEIDDMVPGLSRQAITAILAL